MKRAIITNIQGFSLHDGPGIRTVVFFKGCPLSCHWCANPECIPKKPQVGFIKALCRQCGKCLEVCPNNAILPGENVYRIDLAKCESCGECVKKCEYEALVRYGDIMTVDEVWDAVKKDKMFYDSSGGGVTVSGGEPLLNSGFIRELFERCRSEKIDTCVETCGFIDKKTLTEIISVTDHFLFDLKHLDPAVHKQLTGRSNDQILKNAGFLIKVGADVLFRQPLVPGVNDDPGHINAVAEFLSALGKNAMRLQLMPYHRLGQGKYHALNMEYPMSDTAVMKNETVEAVKNTYLDYGIDCSISR